MNLNFYFLIIIILFKVNIILSLTVYLEYQITHVDDEILSIESSEDIFYSVSTGPHEAGDDFTYIIPRIKHNLLKPLCILSWDWGIYHYYSFKKVTLNEYDITFLPVEKYYFCTKCRMNTPYNFALTLYNNKPEIILTHKSNGKVILYNVNYTFCLYGNNDISYFNLGKQYIKENYYKGKTLKYILNNNNYNFDIDKIFSINENSDFIFDLDTVSLKIYDISNKKGKIYNGNEELDINSTFNAKNKFLTLQRISNDGFLMVITIETRTRLKDLISYSTCEQKANLYLYVAQENCTITEESNNFCQNCEINYAKLGNNCYYKTEKFFNLYCEETEKIWKECQSEKDIFKCSICPKGTFINSMNNCQKCPRGYYNEIEDSRECKKCEKGYFSDILGSIHCNKCPEGFYSLLGAFECFKNCQPGYYPIENECVPCKPGFYSEGSTPYCTQCIPGKFSNREGMNKCIDCIPGTFNNNYQQINCQQCSPNYYSDLYGSTLCKKCEENKYSLFGFNNCLSCNETIPFCNKCAIEGICLDCNNSALSGYDNCSLCENEYDYIFTGEFCKLITICPIYKYKNELNNSKIICINSIEECPNDKIFLNLDTKECESKPSNQKLITGNYQIRGGENVLNEISNNILIETKNFPEFFEEFFLENSVRLKGLNVTVKIGSNKILNNKSDSDVKLNLGECPEILRINYSIKENEDNFLYKILELRINGTRLVKYDIYDNNNLENPLDLSPCKNTNITYIIPINPEDYFEPNDDINSWLKLIREGNDIFNSYSSLYNDICFPLSNLDKYDLNLKDRRNLITRKNLPVCQSGCIYEGLRTYTDKYQVQCFCKIKIDKNSTTLSQFKQGFTDLKYHHNFPVLTCYKLLFSSKGIKKNYGSFLFIFFIFIEIILIIITEIYIKKGYLDNLINYCELYIFLIVEKNYIFKILRKIYLGELNLNTIKKKEKEVIRKFNFEKNKILSSPPIKHKRSLKNTTISYKKNTSISESISDTISFENEKNDKGFVKYIKRDIKNIKLEEVIKSFNKNDYGNYYLNLIFSIYLLYKNR